MDSWAEFKVRARPGSVSGELKLAKTNKWIEVFKMPGSIKHGCFIGFSASSGSMGDDVADEVSLVGLETRNFDSTVIGEEVEKNELDGDQEWIKVLQEDKKFISQSAQSEAVEKLTQMLHKHAERYNSLGQEVNSGLSKLEAKMVDLHSNIGTIKAEIKMPHEGDKIDVGHVMKEIVGLRTLFHKEREDHHAKIDKIHSVAKDVQVAHEESKVGGDTQVQAHKLMKLTVDTQRTEIQVATSSSQTSKLLLFLVASVGVLGCMFFNRMRYYEKKHYI